MQRKRVLRFWAVLFMLSVLGLPATYGCGTGSLIGSASVSPSVISPNGDGQDDFATISYTLSRGANVSIVFIDSKENKYVFRDKERRSVGAYQAKFDGTYAPDLTKPDRQLLADGEYKFTVIADEGAGKVMENQGKLTIKGGDPISLKVTELVSNRERISPNGDGTDDEMRLSYAVSKDAEVNIYGVAEKDQMAYLLEAPGQRKTGLHGFDWNGTSGGAFLPDGKYVLHVQAKDTTGNVNEATMVATITGAGEPKMDILKVKFWPNVVPLGGTLNVEIRVKNSGDVPLISLGPDPGTSYSSDQNFNFWRNDNGEPKYYERNGFWRVGVQCDQSGTMFPFRWGLGKDLAPGEETTITGTIQITNIRTRDVRFWASAVREGVGFPGGQVGIQNIIVSY